MSSKTAGRTVKQVHPWLANRRGRTCEQCGRGLPLRNWRRQCATCIKAAQFLERTKGSYRAMVARMAEVA